MSPAFDNFCSKTIWKKKKTIDYNGLTIPAIGGHIEFWYLVRNVIVSHDEIDVAVRMQKKRMYGGRTYVFKTGRVVPGNAILAQTIFFGEIASLVTMLLFVQM